MNKLLKIIMIVFAALAGLLIVAVVLTVLFFPGERIRTTVEKEASSALGMPVSVGKIGLSFAGLPSVRASDITVGSAQQGETPLLTVKSIKARVNIFALVKKNIEIESLEIDEPHVMLLTREDDSTNLPPSSEKNEPKASGPPQLPFPITMHSFSINDGLVEVDNRKDGSLLTLENLSYQLAVNVTKDLKELNADGKLNVENISYAGIEDDTKKTIIDELSLSFTHELSGDLTTGNVSLSRGDIMAGGMPVSLTADIEGWTKTTFSLSTGTHDAVNLLELIPVALFPDKGKIGISGTYSLDVNGEIDSEPVKSAVKYTGNMDINSMSIEYEGMPEKIEEIHCRIAFNEKDITLNDVRALIGGSRFSVSGTLNNYTETPSLAVTTEGSIDLKEVGDALPQLSESGLKGKMTFKLAVNGPPSDPQAISVDGNATLDGVEVLVPESLQHPALLNGAVSITPSSLTVDNFMLKSGKSDLVFKGTVTDYPALVWPKKGVYAVFKGSLTSDMLDLTDMLIFDEDAPTPKPWHMEQAIKSMPIPPNLSVDNSIKLNTVVFDKLKADSVNGRFTVKDGSFDLHDLNIRAYKGVLSGDAGLTLTEIGDAEYKGSFKLNALDAGAFLSSFFGVREDMFSGKLSSSLTFNGAGLDSVSMLENLTGFGNLDIDKGSISNWKFTRELGSYLKFLNFDKLDFDSIRNKFRVENSQVITPDMRIKTSFADITLDGTAGFDKSIDYSISMLLDETTSAKAARQISALSSLFKGGTGRLELTVDAGGTLTSPKFSLDTSKAEDQLKARLKDSLKKEAEKFLDKQDGDLKKKGKELLKNIFKKN